MSELSPIDNSVVELLRQSRLANEQEIRDTAQAVHNAAKEADLALTIEGLLRLECQSLMAILIERDKHYIAANWIQRLRLRTFGSPALPITIRVDGVITAPTRAQERMIRKSNILKRKTFTVENILPTSPELTDAGPFRQDWLVRTEPFFMHTFMRTQNIDREELDIIAPVHKISMVGQGVKVYDSQGEGSFENDDLYLPLGIILAAKQKVKDSVPREISRKW